MQLVTVDFDGTLFQGDSFKLMFQAGKKQFGLKEWTTVIFCSLQAIGKGIFKGKNALRIHFFKIFAKTFRGKTKEELSSFFNYLIEAGETDINQALIDEIRQHQKKGNQIMILSGALTPFLQALTKKINLEATIIGTELIFDSLGKCTGETGVVVNGEEKVQAVHDWIHVSGEDPTQVRTWAYADSESDIPLLRVINYPIIVNPKAKMREIAKVNNWPVFKDR